MKTLTKTSALFCVAILALTIPIAAQLQLGSLRGTVTDPSGNAIPGAEVTVTAVDTQVQYRAITDSQGAYAIISLRLGAYTLTVRKAGFETATQAGITMNAGDQKAIDVQLKIGNTTQSVEVTGAPPALETDTGSYSETINKDTLIQLPLEVNGSRRAFAEYEASMPGYQGGSFGNPPFDNEINGSVDMYSEVYVNGTPLEEATAGRGFDVRYGFSPEAVAELKVVQTPMADIGNTGGNAISYQLKSGTNSLHGSGYIYQRDTAFDARCEFCTSVSADHQGEYGFEVGGPVYIPKVYDGRNKTFWWFNYGWYHNTSASPPQIFSFPTPAWKAGNLSDQLGAQIGTDDLGRPVLAGQIYNPFSTRTLADGTVIRDPFPGNLIPTALFSSISSKYQTYFFTPNLPGDFNNYLAGPVSNRSPDTFYEINADHNVGSKDHLSGVYWTDRPLGFVSNFQLPEIYGGGSTPKPWHAAHFVFLYWTHTLSPTLDTTATFGITNYGGHIVPTDYSNPVAVMGAALVGQPNPGGTCIPGINVPDLTTPTSLQCWSGEAEHSWAVNDNWTKDAGKHLVKFGFNLIRFVNNFPANWNQLSTFLGGQTGLPSQPNCQNCLASTGVPYGSFLLGAPETAEAKGNQFNGPRDLVFGFYGQDQIRLTPKLTVVLGLRYDGQPYPVELENRISQFDATLPNAAAGGLPGALTFLGFGPGTLNKRQVAPSVWMATNFGPKFSAAYQIFHDTVVHGAYTLSYGPINQTEAGFAAEYQQGFFPTFTVTSGNGYSPPYFWDAGFPFPAGVPLYNNPDPTAYNGSNTGYFGTTAGRAPFIHILHFDVQHQFPGRIVVAANYNGTIAHGILNGNQQPANQLDYAKYGALGTLLTDDINSAAARAANIPIPYAGFAGSVAQALTAFPQYQDIENEGAPLGAQTYNGAQFTAQKQYANGISFLVGYTWSKQLSNYAGSPGYFSNEPQNAYDLTSEKAIYYLEVPQQLLMNYTYVLPVGRGKALNVENRALDEVVGGWSVAGIQTYQTGQTLAVTTQQTIPTDYATIRPNAVPGAPIRSGVSCGSFNPFSDVYLNSGAFTDPAPLTFGNVRPVLPHTFGCPMLSENISAFKTFPIREGLNFRFGADFFNVFNRHQWGAPNTDIDSPAYGAINSQANSPRAIQINGRLSF